MLILKIKRQKSIQYLLHSVTGHHTKQEKPYEQQKIVLAVYVLTKFNIIITRINVLQVNSNKIVSSKQQIILACSY